ncbi:universal stress protein [Nocardia sp. NBC_00565]|uniref:universal stress protein n=1 Tax=Nocardia sp. NBC_00565 TaxID=2975993 RepID=UPI002E814ED4|nr:universal stress protein [Nocardia sp. NBC_00565]WUC03466.1 universal stress protein [Nocardia sp. NBC_00565]
MSDHESRFPASQRPNSWLPRRVDGPPGAVSPRCHMVVGCQRHPVSRAALNYAIDLAPRLNAFVHVVHVVDIVDTPINPDSADWEQRVAETLDIGRRDACAQLAALSGNWAYYTLTGDPAHELARIADNHDATMIVLGAARSGAAAVLGRLLGRSVAARLIRRAHRPVLVVPAPLENP